MSQWYLSYDGKQLGPFSTEQARDKVIQNPNGHVWKAGFAEWLPMSHVSELTSTSATIASPPPLSQKTSDDIDFKVVGAEMQYVEVMLDPGESVIAEAGGMMYKDSAIVMESVFGDHTKAGGGFFDKLVGAGKRLVTGESLFITVFTHSGTGKGKIAFAAPYPGNIVPLTLANVGGQIICQKDSFLCAARGVSIGVFLQKKILTGLFGGEGFIMQKLEGDGLVFLHAGGTVTERMLGANENLDVDTGCVVAFEKTVGFDIRQAGNITTAFFGGEGIFLSHLKGPGRVWLQSLPFSRLAGRMMMATYQQREQGSVLGGILQGDTN